MNDQICAGKASHWVSISSNHFELYSGLPRILLHTSLSCSKIHSNVDCHAHPSSWWTLPPHVLASLDGWGFDHIGSSASVVRLCVLRPFPAPVQHIFFARVGWVTETSASLLFRSTDQVNVSYRPSHDSSAVSHVELSQSSLKTDFTSRLYIEDLQPGITYFYNSTAGHKGFLTTRRSKHDQKQFILLSTSCQKPNWPNNPLSHSLAISGLEHVDKIVRKMERKEAMLFLGDFVCECHIIISSEQLSDSLQTQTYHTLPPTIPPRIIADFTARSILAHLGPDFFVQFPGCICLTTMRSLMTMPLPLLRSPTCSYKPSIHS